MDAMASIAIELDCVGRHRAPTPRPQRGAADASRGTIRRELGDEGLDDDHLSIVSFVVDADAAVGSLYLAH
jgi:hypothetical protein